jgi:phosphomannomutase
MPNIPSLFHAYDIRGTAADGLNAAFAERLGRVIGEIYQPKHLLIGRDMRSTSPGLEEALIKGLNEQGVDAIRISLCSTPLFNVTIGLANGAYDFGIMVTASHNPAQYNGFKFITKDVLPIGKGSGMEEIQDRYLSEKPFVVSEKKGGITDNPTALKEYIDCICSLINIDSIPAMKIAVDAGNGMAGFVLPEFIKRIPQIEVIPLYWELDGTFPNHEANPLKAETLNVLSKIVKENGCNFGAAYDGDCDRIGFVDENGEQIPGDILTALFARALLRDRSGELILRDPRCSWAVEEEIQKAGGRSEMCRVGHAFIKRQLREDGALFAGELSMHFYYRDIWGLESGDLALLLMLREIAQSGKKLSELWRPLKRYATSSEINTQVANATAKISRIRDHYAPEASSISDLDGIRLEFNVGADGKKGPNAWWFSLRPSNTEPVVRLIVEAVDSDVMEEKRDELVTLIQGSV